MKRVNDSRTSEELVVTSMKSTSRRPTIVAVAMVAALLLVGPAGAAAQQITLSAPDDVVTPGVAVPVTVANANR